MERGAPAERVPRDARRLYAAAHAAVDHSLPPRSNFTIARLESGVHALAALKESLITGQQPLSMLVHDRAHLAVAAIDRVDVGAPALMVRADVEIGQVDRCHGCASIMCIGYPAARHR